MKTAVLRSLMLTALTLLLPTVPAHAAFAVLTGTVQDPNGAGIAGVNIVFSDSCTGQLAGATGNVTSATGTFSATVIAGTYDLQFQPPLGSLSAADRMSKFDLTTSRALGIVHLANGITVSGQVTDTTGTPISAAYLHFYRPGGGGRVYTFRDKSDALGNYSVVVAPGTYDLRYGPHSGTPYVALSVPSVSIPGNITLPTVALQTGSAVSGTILDSSGNPVINVNINVFDTNTQASVVLAHDATDSNGMYSVVVPAGTYTIEYEPPKCTAFAGGAFAPMSVSADTTMPTVNLSSGVLVKGFVTNMADVPVLDVNTDYFTLAGAEVVAVDDHTDAAGAFSTYLVPGTYSIIYSPPEGLRLAGVKTGGISMVANPTTVPTVKLPSGFFVSGRAVTSGGVPVQYVRLTFSTAGTNTQVYVAHNATDSAGTFSIVSVLGTYDVVFTPPAGSGLVAVTRTGVVVGADTVLSDTVLPYPAPTVTSTSPGTGLVAGGQTVTVNGTGFRANAGLAFGGVPANVVSLSSATIMATTTAHPAGTVNVAVTNSDGQSATLVGAYSFVEPAIPIALSVARSGGDIILTWTSTGQSSYTVFGAGTPNAWTPSSVLTRTALTTYTVVSGATTPGIEYFNAD